MNSSLNATASCTTARILVNGKPVKIFTDGQGQSWVEAREGSKYQIEVKNNSMFRVLCVASIDGINVISGEEATLEPENGYVINPFSSLKIDGWRISDDSVKEFLFTYDKSKSYSVKLGAGAKNLGVIGIAIFEEKAKPLSWTYTSTGTWQNPFRYNDNYYGGWTTMTTSDDFIKGVSSDFTCSVDASSGYINDKNSISLNSCHVEPTALRSAPIDFHAGTAKGKELESKVTEVQFEAGSLIQSHTIYYDSYAHLVKRGIISENKMPQPFKNTKYCKDI